MGAIGENSVDVDGRVIGIAKSFIINAPTFRFDGIIDTLNITDVKILESLPVQYVVTITFNSRHSGYGDRTGQILLQVITPHEAVVKVVDGNVVSAIIDDKWDELNQEQVASFKEIPLSPEQVRDLTIRYLREVEKKNIPDLLTTSWTGGNETPEGLLGSSTFIYRAHDTVVTIKFPIVLPENTVYKITVESRGELVWQGEFFQGQFTTTTIG